MGDNGSAIRHRSQAARLYYWACQRLYHELAWFYDVASWLVSAGRWARWRRMALDYAGGSQVLEIGFGTGELLIEMARCGFEVCGVELSSAMQRVTARKVRRCPIAVPRVQARTQALPFADASFDTAVSTFPADYILDPQTLHELARVLRRPDGVLVVVGLSVHWRPRARSGTSLPDRRIRRFQEIARAAGFETTCLLRDDPPMQIPVCIARPGA